MPNKYSATLEKLYNEITKNKDRIEKGKAHIQNLKEHMEAMQKLKALQQKESSSDDSRLFIECLEVVHSVFKHASGLVDTRKEDIISDLAALTYNSPLNDEPLEKNDLRNQPQAAHLLQEIGWNAPARASAAAGPRPR